MEILFCIMIFAMGAVFGSFFTLAVYRIPLGLDITHERSFCPKCNHRLEFIDLIPIISYLSLRGKCRYCGEKVRIRYLLLEVLSGFVFVLAYFAFKLSFPYLEASSVSLMIAFVMFYTTNAIILGIDKEYRKIDKRVLLFGIIMQSIYILYLYTFNNMNLYRYGIYLFVMLVLFCIDTFLIKKMSKELYFIQILMLIVYEISFISNFKIVIYMLLLSFLVHIFYLFKKKKINEVHSGFIISIISIFCVLISNLFCLC